MTNSIDGPGYLITSMTAEPRRKDIGWQGLASVIDGFVVKLDIVRGRQAYRFNVELDSDLFRRVAVEVPNLSSQTFAMLIAQGEA